MSEKENKIIFGDCQNMQELKDNNVHLVVTSPPYFNSPFDYHDLFKSTYRGYNLSKIVEERHDI